jgi:hypothetical protein
VLNRHWRRIQGLESGYRVVLNPDVEAEHERLNARLETLYEAVEALRSIDGTDELVAGVDALSRATRAELAELPSVEIVWAQGPNPALGMHFHEMFHGLTPKAS